jgi:hypothetical protein
MKWVLRISGVFVALLILAVGVLFALGHRANAGHIHVSTELNASPEQLWPWLNDGDKVKQWISWLVEVRQDRPTTGAGTKQIWVMHDSNNGGKPMEIEGIYTEYLPPTRQTVQVSSAGSFDGQETYSVANLGAGKTRLQIDGSFHYSEWWAALLEPLITPAAETKLRGDVARLKLLVEKERNGTASSAF